ncbi:hypothetical protein V1517DRAFT_322388 [Lipomyces orientalis]|uniref:Uncharacterized protein n=1 Tax=Lipomyces orientalis TaxID=1233043 RepID=A0ACC3TPD7_9ASCO
MAESADSERSRPRMQSGSFAVGMAAGFVLSSIFPAPSYYLRSLIVRLFDILAVLLAWTVIFVICFATYKILIDKDTEFLSHAGTAIKSVRQHIAPSTTTGDKQEVVSLSPSSEFAARPYPFVHQHCRDSSPTRPVSPSVSSTLSATTKKSAAASTSSSRTRSRSPKKTVKGSSSDSFSFKPYDEDGKDTDNARIYRSQGTSLSTGSSSKSKEKDGSSESKAAIWSSNGSSPTVGTSATRDPNKIPLVAAYVRPDINSPWTKLNEKGLTLKITPDGLLLNDEARSRGSDLKPWMLSLIEVRPRNVTRQA